MELEASVDLRAFKAAWGDKTKKAKEALQRALEETGAAIKRTMQGNAPVRTGALRSSIVARVEGLRVSVGPTVPYAPFLEHGTRPSPGRYVPAIGKKLVNPQLPHFGMHPGIRATHFVDRTASDAMLQLQVFSRILAEALA